MMDLMYMKSNRNNKSLGCFIQEYYVSHFNFWYEMCKDKMDEEKNKNFKYFIQIYTKRFNYFYQIVKTVKIKK